MLIYSNSRITEAKETLRAEMQKGHADIIATLERIASQVKERIASQVKALETNLQNKLKIHELEHHR